MAVDERARHEPFQKLEERMNDRFDARLERALRHQFQQFVVFGFSLAGSVIAAAKLL